MMKRTVLRFVRVVLGQALAALLVAANANLGLLEIPAFLAPFIIPVFGALITAAAKWVRDKFGVEIPL